MTHVSRGYADQIAKDRGEAMDELERRNMSDKQEPHLRFGGAHAKEAIIAALSSAGIDCEGWRDIESAPKDGTEFQAWCIVDSPASGSWYTHCRFDPDSEAFQVFGRVDYDQDGWETYGHLKPTHWRPHPLPPLASGGG